MTLAPEPLRVISRKFAHKFTKSKYFKKIKNKSESQDGSL